MIRTLLLAIIRSYRYLLSPWLGNSCRFWPTCSEYAMQAIQHHGALRGSCLMMARLARCHPYSAGGVDPMPLQFGWRCFCSNAAPTRRASTNSIESDHGH